MTTKLLTKENYITAIKNSVGTNMFRNLFAEVDPSNSSGQVKKKDITGDGELSCALFVSSLLYLFKMIEGVHATVSGTVKDLEAFGWTEISEPKEGALIVWKNQDLGDGDPHPHIGFYIGNGKAISNSKEKRTPIEHELDFRGREIEKILWNTTLN